MNKKETNKKYRNYRNKWLTENTKQYNIKINKKEKTYIDYFNKIPNKVEWIKKHIDNEITESILNARDIEDILNEENADNNY